MAIVKFEGQLQSEASKENNFLEEKTDLTDSERCTRQVNDFLNGELSGPSCPC